MPVGGGAVAQLGEVVLPPGVQVAVRADGRGMLPAYADFFPGESGGRALGLADQGRRVPVGGGAVAQLASEVPSPGVEVAVRAYSSGMVAAKADLFPGESGGRALGLADRDWRVPVGGGAVAQLPVLVVSPDVEVAVRAECCGIQVA